jgi:predicted dehydrogenase
MTVRRVEVGVVGVGYWGPKLVRNLYDTPSADLSWVIDRDRTRLERIGQQYPRVQTSDRYDDLLDSSVEAIVIATPIRTHHALAKAALLRGKHVMIEKPLAASSAECEELIALADARGLTLMVGHTFEYNAAIRALRQIVERGDLGDVYYVDTARLNLGLFQRDINVIWDLAPHDLSILLHVLQREPISVSARGGAHIHQGVHDVVFMELRFPDNILANVHLSWLYPRKERRVTIVGSKKMLVCDDVQEIEKIRIYDKGVDLPSRSDQLPHETDEFFDFHLSYRYGDVSIPHVPFDEPLRAQCGHFLDCIRTGQRPLTDGREGLTVVRLIEAANRSLHEGGRQVMVGEGAALAGVGAGDAFGRGWLAGLPNGAGDLPNGSAAHTRS